LNKELKKKDFKMQLVVVLIITILVVLIPLTRSLHAQVYAKQQVVRYWRLYHLYKENSPTEGLIEVFRSPEINIDSLMIAIHFEPLSHYSTVRIYLHVNVTNYLLRKMRERGSIIAFLIPKTYVEKINSYFVENELVLMRFEDRKLKRIPLNNLTKSYLLDLDKHFCLTLNVTNINKIMSVENSYKRVLKITVTLIMKINLSKILTVRGDYVTLRLRPLTSLNSKLRINLGNKAIELVRIRISEYSFSLYLESEIDIVRITPEPYMIDYEIGEISYYSLPIDSEVVIVLKYKDILSSVTMISIILLIVYSLVIIVYLCLKRVK